MPDVDGIIKSYCDCRKGNKMKIDYSCIHIQLLVQHRELLRGPILDVEEPQSFLVCCENRSLIFSIASMSGSTRHHSHKRTIVVCSSSYEWRCESCSTDRFNRMTISADV